MNQYERKHLGAIKRLSCGVCGNPPPSDAHHIRIGQGMAQKASDWLAIPLCKSCHQGVNGIHGDRFMWKVMGKTELDVLAETIAKMAGK